MAPPPLEHLTSLLLAPFTDAGSRTFWPGLALTALVAAWMARDLGWRDAFARLITLARHPSTRLDVQLLLARQLLRGLRGAASAGGAFAVAAWIVLRLDHSLGAPTPLDLPPAALAALYSLSLFVAWDASRFAAHWLMHKVPALWAFHQVHHSAERLNPLTFHRVHPVESLVYDLRGALTTGGVAGLFYWLTRGQAEPLTLLGVPALGLALNVLTGNLRHSEVWIRFPAAVEGWLLSPAQHQLHHSAAPEHADKNLGTWLACWDRLAGSLVISDKPPVAFGLLPAERNHRDDLLSALFGPFVGAARAIFGPRALAALGLLAAKVAEAQDPEPSPEETPETPEEAPAEPAPRPRAEGYGAEILIYAEDGTPRVAGSAHRVDEETLERFEYDNVERVLAEVPGVSTRGEDGYGLRPNIGMRGASSDRSAKVTLMEDGVLFAPAPYAAPAAYYFPMSTRLVGVEVFKGPAAHPARARGSRLRPRPRGRPVPHREGRRVPRLWRRSRGVPHRRGPAQHRRVQGARRGRPDGLPARRDDGEGPPAPGR
ncbi:sterol desaturase family protein [Myxococcota bacterium]|nr:sterol desaturase family protein [Myxococcota bacterium]